MTVYVVQDQKWVDPNGQLKPKFDFGPAEEFGELSFLLRPGSSPFNLEPVLDRLHSVLQHYDADQDYLLLTGNPVLLGLAVAVATHYADGRVRMLQWSGAKKRYLPVEADGVHV